MLRSHCFSLLLFLTVVCFCSTEDDTCDSFIVARNREQLFEALEHSLLSDGGNLYNIRNLLFPPEGVFPELAEIIYRLNFVESNSSEADLFEESSMCPCPGISTDNDLATDVNTMVFGWTTIGLYTQIHPALLNQLQPQLPFILMRIFAPDNVPFLWDGCSNLPNVTIDLTVPLDNLTCIPSLTKADLNEALKILTSSVR